MCEDVPQLNLRLGSKLRHSNILEGNDVYFECNIRANPWVSETGWKFEGRELVTNISAGVIGWSSSRKGGYGADSFVKPLLYVDEHCPVEKLPLGALPCVTPHVAKECHKRTIGLSRRCGLILGLTVCPIR
ncbi:nephrin [Trichonephila clavipes]|nr:nephrin [Trichonephila clavipes]